MCWLAVAANYFVGVLVSLVFLVGFYCQPNDDANYTKKNCHCFALPSVCCPVPYCAFIISLYRKIFNWQMSQLRKTYLVHFVFISKDNLFVVPCSCLFPSLLLRFCCLLLRLCASPINTIHTLNNSLPITLVSSLLYPAAVLCSSVLLFLSLVVSCSVLSYCVPIKESCLSSGLCCSIYLLDE